jgi:hypothetical protein
MKREELKKLLGENALDTVIDEIMKIHGTGIEELKTKLTTTEGERDAFKTQAETANAQIESFKGMKKPEEVDAAVAEWKTKYEQAQEESKNQLAAVKFEHALDGALGGAKAKNPKAVKALLDMDVLKKAYDEKTGTIVNFDEHLKPVKEQNDYLFESDKPAPRIVTGGNNKTVTIDPLEAGMLRGAKLTPED